MQAATHFGSNEQGKCGKIFRVWYWEKPL